MRKKLFFILISLLAFAGELRAQAGIGLAGGLNISSYSFYQLSSNWKAGIHAGGYVDIPLSSKFALEVDLLYSQKGGKVAGDTLQGGYTQALNYLSLPVLLEYWVTGKFSLELGPEAGLLLSSAIHSSNGMTFKTDEFQSSDKGLAFGAGYRLPAGFTVEARYVAGFKPISKRLVFTDFDGNQLGSGSYGNNSLFQLTVHYCLKRFGQK